MKTSKPSKLAPYLCALTFLASPSGFGASKGQPSSLTMRPDKTGQETCDAFRRYRHEASQLVRQGVRGCAGFSEVPAAGESSASHECRKVVLKTILDHLSRQEAPGSGSGGGGEYTLGDLERVCPNLWR